MCIGIVGIWWGIAYGQILSIICPQHDSGEVLSFHVFIYYLFSYLFNIIFKIWEKNMK